MDRRSFVTDTLGAAGGLALGASEAVGTPHVVELRGGLRSLYALDDSYGSGGVLPLTVRHLRRVSRVINQGTYPDTIGRQLRLIAGETAEHCAWLSFDAGDQETARRYWGEALTTATTIRDTGLEILVLNGLTQQAIAEGRARDAHDLSRAGRERAVPFGSSTLLSLFALWEARALVMTGDKRAADKCLAESMKLIERSGGRSAPEWAKFHGAAEIQCAQGILYDETGHSRSAVPYLRAALTHRDRTYGRNSVMDRIRLAASLVRAGEVDEGATLAVDTIPALEEVTSGRVTERLKEVRDLLGKVDSVSAREARQELTDCIRGRQGTRDGNI